MLCNIMKKHLQKPELINFTVNWQKDTLTLDGLEKGQLIQLDDFTRIKLQVNCEGTFFFQFSQKTNEKCLPK